MNEMQFNESIQKLLVCDKVLRNRFKMNLVQKQCNPYSPSIKYYLVMKHYKEGYLYNLVVCYNEVFGCVQVFFEIQDIESGQFVGLEKVYKKEDLKKIFIMERNPLDDSMMFTFHSCMVKDEFGIGEPQQIIYQTVGLYLSKLDIFL